MLTATLAEIVPALVLDVAVGDPVSRWHPVALFGRAVDRVLGLAPAGPRAQLAFGFVLVLLAVVGAAGGSAVLLNAVGATSALLAAVLGAVLLKTSFAYRQLRTEALSVARALEGADVDRAQTHLRALVSRDTTVLTTAMAASAAIESLAENLCDSVVAPFLYYLLLGVPGALAYRAINTLDAMIGYRGHYEYLGKAAARLDDVVSWIPARLTALLLMAGAWLAHADAPAAVSAAWRQHSRTASPNAGWPMAAMAGAIGVRLEKSGHYVLCLMGSEPTPASIRSAVRVADRAVVLAVGLLIAAAVL